MKLTKKVRSISYLKANAAEVVATLAADREPYVITQNGEARAVLVDVETWEQKEETLALLKILALGTKELEQRKTRKAREFVKELRAGLKAAR